MAYDNRLNNLTCDKCGKPATRWYGDTSATLCNNPICYEQMHQSYLDHIEQEERASYLGDDNECN